MDEEEYRAYRAATDLREPYRCPQGLCRSVVHGLLSGCKGAQDRRTTTAVWGAARESWCWPPRVAVLPCVKRGQQMVTPPTHSSAAT